MSKVSSFSLEFSPIKAETERGSIARAIRELDQYGPELITVTYGAGGSARQGTFETLKFFQEHTDCPLACHLTHISTTKADLNTYLDQLWENGIRHIVALRGDRPKDPAWQKDKGAEYYSHTNDFVRSIVRHHPFGVSVGAYPERHPDSPTFEHDIKTLKMKCDEGASSAFTQFFFDNNIFYRFRDAASNAGITTPIVPGLMRIVNIKGMQVFASRIHATVPRSLTEKFAAAAAEDHAKLAEDVLFRQVEDLERHGVKRFHFYTMNQAWGLARSIAHVLK